MLQKCDRAANDSQVSALRDPQLSKGFTCSNVLFLPYPSRVTDVQTAAAKHVSQSAGVAASGDSRRNPLEPVQDLVLT